MINLLTQSISSFNTQADKADLLLKRQLRRRHLGKKERTTLYELFYFYLRHKEMVEFFSQSDDSTELAQITLLLVREGISAMPPHQIERWHNLTPNEQETLYHSYPPFWSEQIEVAFGSDYATSIKSYLNSRGGVTLLNLSRRQSMEELVEHLARCPLELEFGKLSPHALYVKGHLPTALNLLYDVQDEASQLTALLVNPESHSCLDFCAGHGGKSIALGSFWPNLKLSASDIRAEVAQGSLERAKRAGIKLRWVEKNEIKNQFDTVFVDAPCSGSGVWRRNPEDRYRVDKKKYESIISLQRNILLEAGSHVKHGGELIYITCSFSHGENEENIQWFLSKVKGYQLVNAYERFKKNLFLHHLDQHLPQYYMMSRYLKNKITLGGDLFFGAILVKE